MNKEKLIPKLRFEGFENNEWIPYKLKNIVRFSKGRGYSKNDLLEQGSPIILYGRMYTNYEIVIHNVDTYAKPKENTIYSEGTEVIVPSSGETAEDIARASFVSKKGIILGGDLNIMHLIEEHNPFFLALSISNGDRKKELIRRAQGSSVVHLYNTDLENAVVYFPTLTEQNKISSFLEKIDEMIKLQQSKVNKVKDLKSAYLSEMFPKEGEEYPKKRFEGFNEPWKKYSLDEIAHIIGGGTPNTNIPQYWGGNINWYSPTEIGDKVYVNESLKKITKLGMNKSSANLLPKERTILFTSRAGIGHRAILKEDATTNQGFQSLVLKDNVDTYFMYSMGHIIKKYAEQNASGSTFMEISGKQLGKMKVYIPSFNEQARIGKFFKNLDKQIAIEEEKLVKLEKLKQAYLNDMFV